VLRRQERQTHPQDDSPELGSQWVFVAMDAETKLVPVYMQQRFAGSAKVKFLGGPGVNPSTTSLEWAKGLDEVRGISPSPFFIG
jgi:hypothetical protein